MILMAGKRKQAKSPDKKERRVSPRVQELRQKALDEKERLALERVRSLSNKTTEICVDETEFHDKEEDDVSGSLKRSSPSNLTTMQKGKKLTTKQKGKQKLDFYGNGNDDDKDAHLKVRKNLRFFNKQYLLMVQVCFFFLPFFVS